MDIVSRVRLVWGVGGLDGGMPISFPFRVQGHDGAVAAVSESSDQHISESIAVHVLTHPGERHLNPTFGTPQLPFGDPLADGPLQLNLTDNGWSQVRIASATTAVIDDDRAQTTIHWEVA